MLRFNDSTLRKFIVLGGIFLVGCGQEAQDEQSALAEAGVANIELGTSADSAATLENADSADALPAGEEGDEILAAAEVPASLEINAISAEGSACPDESSYSASISPDRKAFTITFSAFIAELGPSVPKSENRKNCSVTLSLQVPKGWQYSIGTFNYRGFMDLSEGVQAEHSTSYFFQGRGKAGSFKVKEKGPIAKDFVYTQKVGLSSVAVSHKWSPCNVDRDLTIDTAISLKNTNVRRFPDAQGLITNDSIDGELTQKYGLIWRKCK